jgi:hypothetical protein
LPFGLVSIATTFKYFDQERKRKRCVDAGILVILENSSYPLKMDRNVREGDSIFCPSRSLLEQGAPLTEALQLPYPLLLGQGTAEDPHPNQMDDHECNRTTSCESWSGYLDSPNKWDPNCQSKWGPPQYSHTAIGQPIAPDRVLKVESRFKAEQHQLGGSLEKRSKPVEKKIKNRNFIYLCCSINNWLLNREKRVYTSKWNSSKVGFQVPSNISNAFRDKIQIYKEIYWERVETYIHHYFLISN